MSERRSRPRRGPGRKPPGGQGSLRGGGSARAAKAKPTTRAQAGQGPGGEQVEGRQAVAELLSAGRRTVIDVWVAADSERASAPAVARILELAAGRGVPVRRVPASRLEAEARTGTPQGVLAHALPLPDVELDDLCRAGSTGGNESGAGRREPPFLLALDGVTDPQNLGALLRSAEGAGVTGAILPRHRAAHVTATVAKAAAGAIEHVPIAVVAGLPAALARARDLGLWILGLDPGADQSLFDLTLADQGVVVVLGAEGRGLSRLVRERCDLVLEIPLKGRLPSLNVAAAGALALFEVSRRRSPGA